MSQDTFVLQNESGAAHRASLNAALQALASGNIGTGRPATTYQGQPWIDSDYAADKWAIYRVVDPATPANDVLVMVIDIVTKVITVAGRDIAADGTKLDSIEASATADQTKTEIDALGINADQVDGVEGSQIVRNNTTASQSLDGNITLGVASASGSSGGRVSLTKAPDDTSTGNPYFDANVGRLRLVSSPGGVTNILSIPFESGEVWHSGSLEPDTLQGLKSLTFANRITAGSSIVAGNTYAGSELRIVGLGATGDTANAKMSSSATGLSGTWRAMCSVSAEATYYPMAIFVRVL